LKSINSAIHKIAWPVSNILAMQTSRFPQNINSVNLATSYKKNSYDHFNLGLHVGDLEKNVLVNRKCLLNNFNPETKIQWLEQVHGSDVAEVSVYSPHVIQADALVTRSKNLALAIMTADCLPILLSNVDGTEVAAIHGGWRSLADDIIVKTLDKMHSRNETIFAWLGPCIGQTHFEVGDEVRQHFNKSSPNSAQFFIENKIGKLQADLAGIASFLLKKSGVSSVVNTSECTFTLKDKYYSYRRENITGRMASVIAIAN